MISYQLAWEIISVLHPTELLLRWHTQKKCTFRFAGPTFGREECAAAPAGGRFLQ